MPEQVFISHVYEERQVALVLQKYIRQAFNDAVSVFAAFDKESIGGGKEWFSHITTNLRGSAIVLVLVSHASRRRSWLNFEAGFGGGAGADVIPVLIRGLSPAKVEFPLAGYQVRSIDDLPSIQADITNKLGTASAKQDIEDYLEEIRIAESQVANKTLLVSPFVRGNALHFEIKNEGNTDVELLMLEVLIPKRYVSRDWPPSSPLLHHERRKMGDEEYFWFACTSRRGEFGTKEPSLRPILTPTMGAVDSGIHLPVSQEEIPHQNMRHPIRYQIHAVDYPTEMEHTDWASIEAR